MGQANYSAAKAGDIGFVKALAQEGAAKGITVNAICPGYIATEMVMAVPQEVREKRIIPLIPLGRLGEVSEIARCVAFLAADEASFITGSTITANGAESLALVEQACVPLRTMDIADIFKIGLHEFLTESLARTAEIASTAATDYHFN